MKEPTNHSRSEAARAALDAYLRRTRAEGADRRLSLRADPGIWQESVTDLLTDLMHLADRAHLDWWELQRRAELHHDAEVYEERIVRDSRKASQG